MTNYANTNCPLCGCPLVVGYHSYHINLPEENDHAHEYQSCVLWRTERLTDEDVEAYRQAQEYVRQRAGTTKR